MRARRRALGRPAIGRVSGKRGHDSSRAPFLTRLRLELLEDRQLLSVVTDSLDVFRQNVAVDWNPETPGLLTLDLACNDYAVEAFDGYGDRLTASGMTTGGNTGEPELPRQTIRVALPPDADLESIVLSITTSQPTLLPGRYDLGPGPEAGTYSEAGEWISASPEISLVDGRNPLVYSTNAGLDPLYCELLGVQQMGRYKIVELAYSPFDYNPVTDQVSVVPSGTLTLTFDTNDPLPGALLASNRWDDAASQLLVNAEDALALYGDAAVSTGYAEADAGGPADYVILTTDAIVAGSSVLDEFVAVKELLGHTVYVATETDWGGGTGDAAAENLRAWLQANYASMGIKYVLLVGDPHPATGDVPMKMAWPRSSQAESRESPTDYYYAELTSNWDADGDGHYGEWGGDFNSFPLQEVVVGRIPVYNDNHADLDHILLKTIDYTTELDADWRESMILPMAVIHYRNEDGLNYPPLMGDASGERIVNDIAVPNGYDHFTLYEKAGLAPVATPCDAPLTKDNFLDEWAANPPGIVGWIGHGSGDSASRLIWATDSNGNGRADSGELQSPKFITSSDLDRLDDTHPAIVIQGSCNNGYPESVNNLGYSLLKEGAVATVSASRVSWCLFYYGSTYTFNTHWGDIASHVYSIIRELVSDPQSVSIGQAMKQARLSFSPPFMLYNIWMNWTNFNLYGDPSVKLGSVLPASIEGTVFEDTDLDGTQEEGEPAISGAIVYLDANGNTAHDPEEPQTTTGSDGRYSFTGLRVGTHQLRIVAPEGFAQYSPAWGTPQVVTLSVGDAVADVNFGLGPGSTISGHVWHDIDGNAAWDGSEPGLNGWTIYVDSNGNGQFDPGEIAVVTQNDTQGNPGYYELTNVAAGLRTIAQVPQTYWDPTFPAAPGVHAIEVILGQDATNLNFGNQSQLGSISGYVWNDLDGNATWDTAEPGLNGRVVFLDANANGQFDPGETSMTTHDDLLGNPGYYELTGLLAGTYVVAHVQPPTWVLTSPPASSGHDVTLTVAEDSEGWNFGSIENPARIEGHVWYDLDANSLWDAGEPGWNGWRVYLDTNANGQFDAGERSVVTRDDGLGNPGYYEIINVPVGTHALALGSEPGWTATAPSGGVHSILAGPGETVVGVDFGRALSEGTILVSTLADEVNGDLSYGDVSLREALAAAAGASGANLIVFDPRLAAGTITLVAAGTLSVDSQVTIIGISDDPDTTEVDERISVSGAGAYGVMAVTTGIAAELHALILTSGSAVNGAGLRIDSGADVSLADFKISDCATTGNGGGIHVQAASLSLVGCEVTGNTTALAGGGLYGSAATITTSDSTFTGNVVTGTESGCWGGGIWAEGASLVTVTGSTFDGNSSVLAAGGLGISGTGTRASITNSTFTNNKASHSGAGVLAYLGAELLVEACYVANNQANSNGGGIYIYNATATIIDTSIVNNAARWGGGVIAHGTDATLTIQGGEVIGNSAISYGGGVFVYAGAAMIANSRISENCVTGTDEYVGCGGGVSVWRGTANIITTSIVNNTAGVVNGGWGGGIDVKGTDTTVTIQSGAVIGNTATYGGGVRIREGATVNVFESVVTGNSAEQGGGIDIIATDGITPTMVVFNSVITNNHAYSDPGCPLTGRGGAIRAWDAASLTIVNTLIANNMSENYSPGLFLHNSPMTMTNSTVAGNTAPSSSYGAGIHLDSSTATVRNSIVTNNGSGPNVSGTLSTSSRNNLIGQEVLFVDPAGGDYRLQPGSPAINAGDDSFLPADQFDLDGDGNTSEPVPHDLDGKPRIIYSTVDIGAYEFVLGGDANRDGAVNAIDAAIMAANWGREGNAWLPGDFNGNGTVDAEDAKILAANWGTTLSMPPAAAPAPEATPPGLGEDQADGTAFVGPLPVGSMPATRQPILPVQRLGGLGTQQRTQQTAQQRAYTLRSPADVLIETTSESSTAALDTALAEEYGPAIEPPSLLSRQAAWSSMIARRQANRPDFGNLGRAELAVDLLMAVR